MKLFHAACFAILAVAGCNRQESSSQSHSLPAQESPTDNFKGAINGGTDLIFTDTVKQGPGSERQSIKLRFSKDSKVTIEEFGYGIDIYLSSYSINSEGDLNITSPRNRPRNWPTLVISKEGARLTLSRKDGLRSFKEHGNFWPEVEEQVFPLKAKLPNEFTIPEMAIPMKSSD